MKTQAIPAEKPTEAQAINPYTKVVADALNGIGIPTFECDHIEGGFLDKVLIDAGGILYRSDAPPSNLLHEAGHLACIPTIFRPMASKDLEEAFHAMGLAIEKQISENGDPDHPLIRAIMQCSDPEATAWAWAFGVHIGIPPEQIILDSEYDGDGGYVRVQVSTGNYPGINGLRAAGMIRSTRDYPKLEKWLQDAE